MEQTISPSFAKKGYSAGRAVRPALALLLGALMLTLSGCKIGPNYHRPELDMPEGWRFDIAAAEELANTGWWAQFDDPVLDTLIVTALQENKDLKIAAARIDRFKGLYRSTRSSLFPHLGSGASAGRVRTTENGPEMEVSNQKLQELMSLNQQLKGVISGVEALSGTGDPTASMLNAASQSLIHSSASMQNPYNTFQAGFNASWELDLWGKFRRANESARADLLSAEEARNGVILMLVSAVAESYVNLRSLDRALEIAQATVQTQEETYDLFKRRFEKGVVSQLALSQVESIYQQARATLPSIERAAARQEHALCLLLGRNPGAIARGKSLDALCLPVVPAGLPSSLLINRPDIRQAEQALISANAQIGAARAQYFPSISLTGAFGWASSDIVDLFGSSSESWNFSAPVTVPIFTAGAISGRVKAAKAAQQEALIRYQQTIQNAFRDVEDALVTAATAREELDAKTLQFEAFKTYAHLAKRRYESGYSSYMEVLDADRGLFSAELAVSQARGNLFIAMVGLYKAMGCGWTYEIPAEPAATQ